MRPTYAAVDDATLTRVVGLGHRYGNARMSLPGILGVVAGAATAVTAFLTGRVAPGARQLQQRWDSIINLRATLQGAALLGFCLTLAPAAA